MENAKDLLQLPDNVLTEILSFLPNRFDLALVCKKFYELISESEKNLYKIKVVRRFNEVIDRIS